MKGKINCPIFYHSFDSGLKNFSHIIMKKCYLSKDIQLYRLLHFSTITLLSLPQLKIKVQQSLSIVNLEIFNLNLILQETHLILLNKPLCSFLCLLICNRIIMISFAGNTEFIPEKKSGHSLLFNIYATI